MNNDLTVTVYEAKDGWRWRTQASNGEIISTSGEGYVSMVHATAMARRLHPDSVVTIQEAD